MSLSENQVQRLIQASKAGSIKELADFIGEKPNTISTWKERGIPAKKIFSISQIVNCRPEWLENGEGEMRESKVASVDMNLVKQVIEAAMEHLLANNLEMAPDKFAELIEVLYEEISESGAEQVNKGTVARLIKLAM